ncbi:MAG TPA: helix-turn-helix domain-containing protein [Baekduia sp.]|nr:helix-turn-helix domain-containing protein [Baekduia sp.]
MIRLSELLDRRELGLRLAVDGRDPARIEILAAEVCELPDPRPWLESGSMLLTTGVGLGHGAHAQRLLVERAVQAGTAALGFAVGLAHEDVPGGVLQACRGLGLPLVVVPPGTPFRLLTAAVSERAAPHQLQTAQRGLSMQSYLMEALSAPEPEAEVLRRLGSLLSGAALIADEAGGVEGAASDAVPPELWGPLRGGKSVALHHIRGRRYVTAPVGGQLGARRWIVVVGDARALPDQLARQALQSAERLVQLINRARPPRPAEARAARADLAEQLLGFRPAAERRVLASRAAALGLGTDAALQVAVLRPAGDDLPREARSQHAARLLAELEQRMTAGETPFLLVQHDGDIVVVAPDPVEDALRRAATDMPPRAVPIDVGVGRAVAALDGLPRSLLDARFAVEQLLRAEPERMGGNRMLAHADLDLATALVCDADPAVAEPRRAALLDRITARELRETLLAYLDHELDVQRTAASLHLHANSLRYRLGRIEQQLGRSLRDPATIANLYLAVMLERAG